MSNTLLERALAAEERVDGLLERIADLESRMRAALNADPTTASRALSWIGRAENAESLLAKLLLFIDQRAVDTSKFPGGWVSQAQAQMKAVAVMNRDLTPLAERPEDNAYWTTHVDSKGHRQVVHDEEAI